MNELVYRLRAVWSGCEQREKGTTAVEYALMVALIAVVIIGAVTTLGSSLQAKLTSVNGSVSTSSQTP